MIDNALALVVGSFFVLARFRFFYDPSQPKGSRWLNADRYKSLSAKIKSCGIKRANAFWTWYTAVVEVFGGALFAVSVWRPVIGPLILGLLLVATLCTARSKVCEQNPVDKIDACCAYLWRVEGLYIAMTALVVWCDWSKILGG